MAGEGGSKQRFPKLTAERARAALPWLHAFGRVTAKDIQSTLGHRERLVQEIKERLELPRRRGAAVPPRTGGVEAATAETAAEFFGEARAAWNAQGCYLGAVRQLSVVEECEGEGDSGEQGHLSSNLGGEEIGEGLAPRKWTAATVSGMAEASGTGASGCGDVIATSYEGTARKEDCFKQGPAELVRQGIGTSEPNPPGLPRCRSLDEGICYDPGNTPRGRLRWPATATNWSKEARGG